jgi:hypothetical protein
MSDYDGTVRYIHIDNASVVRSGTDVPKESNDTSNGPIGTQTSFQFFEDGTPNKTLSGELDPEFGLEMILKTDFYEGKYTNGAYSDGVFYWPLAEESPHLMQDPDERLPGGRSHSPISHASLNSLSIQALYKQIEELKDEIEELRSGGSGLDVAGIR